MKRVFIALLIVIFGLYTWGKFTGNSFYFGKTTLANHHLSSATVFGPFSAAKMSIDKLLVYGYAEIDASTIGQSLSVKGPLQVYGSHILGMVEVEGPFEINDSTVNGFTKVAGTLTASRTVFKNDLSITSKKIKLSAVTIEGNLLINGRKSEQVLELADGTVIKGGVEFKSGMGILIKGKDSKIEGKIVGEEFKPS
jgi:hypothetical protein